MAFTNNKIKLATSTVPSGCIGKDTIQIGVDQTVTFGPTSSTGFWNGIAPPANGWTVYLTKGSQGPSIYRTTDIVASTKQISGNNSISTEAQALNWYFTQTDKIVTNKTFGSLKTNGLRMAFDADFPPSYDRTSSVYDMAADHLQLLTNGTYVGNDKSTLYLNNNSGSAASNTKHWTINTNITFQTISIWIKTLPQAATTYTLFGSGTSQLNADTTAIGGAWNGCNLFENGVPVGNFVGLNQVIRQDSQWYNFIFDMGSPILASKLSVLSRLGVNGTDGNIGEVYCWAGSITDTEANEHFNEFCSRYSIC